MLNVAKMKNSLFLRTYKIKQETFVILSLVEKLHKIIIVAYY